MDPITLALLFGIGLIGGARRSSGLQSAAAETRMIAERNSAMLEFQAADAVTRGELRASITLQRARQVQGQQAVALASGGVDVASGSALDALASTRIFGELDASIARNNAAREGWGLDRQAFLTQQQGIAEERRLKRQATGSFLGTIGSSIGSGLQAL